MKNIIVTSCGAALLLISAAASAANIVCWTDEHGARACGDRLPPQYAQQERQVLDHAGRVVQVKPRRKTEAELAAERARAEQLAAEKQRQAEQSAYDQYLLTTFNSVIELERARDSRLGTLDRRLQLAEESLGDTEKGIAELQQQIAEIKAEDRKVPVKVSQNLKNFEETLEANRQAVNKLHGERQSTVERYARDIARYQQLTHQAQSLH